MRRLGIGIVVVLRIALLFALLRLIECFQGAILSPHIPHVIDAAFNLHSIIVLCGGVFIVYTASKEILHMMNLEEHEHIAKAPRSVASIAASIVAMNIVFSFDSILSAMALTHVFWVMAGAIVIGGVLMIWLADHVANFLQRNRMYEVLGLFVLFVVGIMLLSEGGHLAHLHLFGHAVLPMSKATFYFVIGVLVVTEVVQSRYQRKILRARQATLGEGR